MLAGRALMPAGQIVGLLMQYQGARTSLEGLEKIMADAQDFLPLLGTDYVELYVGNAKQSAHYYNSAWGFQSLAYAGLETGMKDRTSYVLVQRSLATFPLHADSRELLAQLEKHFQHM